MYFLAGGDRRLGCGLQDAVCLTEQTALPGPLPNTPNTLTYLHTDACVDRQQRRNRQLVDTASCRHHPVARLDRSSDEVHVEAFELPTVDCGCSVIRHQGFL